MTKIILARRMVRKEVEVVENRRIVRAREQRLPSGSIFGTIRANDPLVHIGFLTPSEIETSIVHSLRPA